MAANVLMYQTPGYDVFKDFRHVMAFTTADVMLVVNPASGITSVQDLIARALAVAGAKRNPRLPDVKTLTELGVPGVEIASWGGVSVPAGTPDAIVARIYEAFGKAVKQPAVIKASEDLGNEITPSTPEGYVARFRSEIELTRKMMKTANLAAM